MDESPANPAFSVLGPLPPQRPVLLSVPHAGRDYAANLLAQARVDAPVLRRLEDRYADQLINGAIAAGFSAVVAHRARAEIDLNRAENDMEPGALADPVAGLRPSQRARGGLGLIPTRLSGQGDLWRAAISIGEYRRRITEVHRPYHTTVANLLAAGRAQAGGAVLLDIHSMPMPADPVDIVFGDRFGLTADGALTDALIAAAEGMGFSAARNHPYAGAHGIERHAARSIGIEAVQIEIGRHRYLTDAGELDPAGVQACCAMVARLASTAQGYIAGLARPIPIAAE